MVPHIFINYRFHFLPTLLSWRISESVYGALLPHGRPKAVVELVFSLSTSYGHHAWCGEASSRLGNHDCRSKRSLAFCCMN
jgi:hypothetical protein